MVMSFLDAAFSHVLLSQVQQKEWKSIEAAYHPSGAARLTMELNKDAEEDGASSRAEEHYCASCTSPMPMPPPSPMK